MIETCLDTNIKTTGEHTNKTRPQITNTTIARKTSRNVAIVVVSLRTYAIMWTYCKHFVEFMWHTSNHPLSLLLSPGVFASLMHFENSSNIRPSQPFCFMMCSAGDVVFDFIIWYYMSGGDNYRNHIIANIPVVGKGYAGPGGRPQTQKCKGPVKLMSNTCDLADFTDVSHAAHIVQLLDVACASCRHDIYTIIFSLIYSRWRVLSRWSQASKSDSPSSEDLSSGLLGMFCEVGGFGPPRIRPQWLCRPHRWPQPKPVVIFFIFEGPSVDSCPKSSLPDITKSGGGRRN